MSSTNEPIRNGPALQELMFEYEHLRREILQQDTQSIQTLVGIVFLLSGLTTIAFGVAVSGLLLKGVLFLLVQMIVCIGLWQTIQRIYTSLTIASYLRTFVEPKTAGLRWESRLKKYRPHAEAAFRSLRFGEFFNYLIIYLFLIVANFLLSAGYAIYQLRLSPSFDMAITLILVMGALTLLFLWTCMRILRSYSANGGEAFDTLWTAVKAEEQSSE